MECGTPRDAGEVIQEMVVVYLFGDGKGQTQPSFLPIICYVSKWLLV